MHQIKRILLLEDSMLDAELVMHLLRRDYIHLEFCVVMHKVEFLEALENYNPDIIISDNTLPQFSAVEALEIFNDRGLEIPFILVTGTVSEEFAVEIIKKGADDYILKDRLTRLPLAIEKALQNRRARREKKENEQRLIKSELSLKAAQALAHVSNWDVQLDRNIHTWSDESYTMLGITREEATPSRELFLSFVHPDDRQYAWNKLEESFVHFRESSFDFRFITRQGETRHGYLKWVFDNKTAGGPLHLVGILQDITERKKDEEERKRLSGIIEMQRIQEQKNITQAIMNAEAKERTEIGMELHDNVNQMLGAIHLYIDMARKNDASRDKLLEDASLFTLRAIEEIRSLTKTLITPAIQEIGLQESVQNLAQQLMGVHPIRIVVTVENFNEAESTDKFRLNLFRIVQEQLNNIIKHAKASEVNIRISGDEHRFVLIIKDNGVGFDTSKKRAGVGVTNIRSRTELYQGVMQLLSRPGEGTVLEVQFRKNDISIHHGEQCII